MTRTKSSAFWLMGWNRFQNDLAALNNHSVHPIVLLYFVVYLVGLAVEQLASVYFC